MNAPNVVIATVRAVKGRARDGSRFAIRYTCTACEDAPEMVGAKMSAAASWRANNARIGAAYTVPAVIVHGNGRAYLRLASDAVTDSSGAWYVQKVADGFAVRMRTADGRTLRDMVKRRKKDAQARADALNAGHADHWQFSAALDAGRVRMDGGDA